MPEDLQAIIRDLEEIRDYHRAEAERAQDALAALTSTAPALPAPGREPAVKTKPASKRPARKPAAKRKPAARKKPVAKPAAKDPERLIPGAGSTRSLGRASSSRKEDALRLAHEQPGITVGKMSQALGLAATVMYQPVRQLEEEGLVYRENGRVFLKPAPGRAEDTEATPPDTTDSSTSPTEPADT